MIYRFITLADIHWGAMDSELTYQHLQYVLDFIRKMKNQIDFVVIAGDYFDYRIQLNSRTALLAVQWFDELVNTCKENGVKKIRMFKGTREHDNDQLEIFRPTYELGDGFFRLFTVTMAEDLFKDLRVVYCPDENLNLEDYHRDRWYAFVPNPDIGFFHGNFDTILPSIEFDRIQKHHLNTMIYQYEIFSRLIRGPMISGHWHNPTEYKSQYYVGSYDRWAFGEEEDKGFIYGAYNTEDSSYYIHRVKNPLARLYQTLVVTSDACSSPADFAVLLEKIRNLCDKDPMAKFRLNYIESTEDSTRKDTFDEFRKELSSLRQVKLNTTNLVKREEKTHERKRVETESKEFSYIFNRDIKAVPSIIQRFIRDKHNEDYPIEKIEKYVNKYLRF